MEMYLLIHSRKIYTCDTSGKKSKEQNVWYEPSYFKIICKENNCKGFKARN